MLEGETPALRRIRRPDSVPVRELWPAEAIDFTPWLAEHLEYLDVLGLGALRLVRTEAPLPDGYRTLDILAETADERRVAIENQFGAADFDHLTRGLAYAVGHGAAALVVIAEAHQDEFIAVAQYLNRAAEGLGLEAGGIAVYLVTMSVERVDEWFLPRFELTEGPNRWLSEAGGTRRLRSVEEFLGLLEPDRRPVLRAIIDDWTTRPGASVTHNAEQAIALRMTKPISGTVAVITAWVPGSIWLNRGYLVGAMEPAGVGEEEIDELISSTWPSARAGEKRYYLSVPDPDLSEYRRFADALWRLRERIEAGG